MNETFFHWRQQINDEVFFIDRLCGDEEKKRQKKMKEKLKIYKKEDHWICATHIVGFFCVSPFVLQVSCVCVCVHQIFIFSVLISYIQGEVTKLDSSKSVFVCTYIWSVQMYIMYKTDYKYWCKFVSNWMWLCVCVFERF